MRPSVLLRVGTLVALVCVLTGCLLPPHPVTDAGQDVFGLYVAILVLAAIVFVGVEGFIIYAVVRYRRRPGDDDLPAQHHGNTLVEIIWTAIPAVIVLILFVLSTITLGSVNARSERPGVTIQVDGFQWNWSFRYPDGVVVDPGTPEQPPVLTLPVGEPIRLRLNSLDVIHAFYVPEFLIKRDLIPVGENGTSNELEFTITEAGTYTGQCAEFCGTMHAEMIFEVNAVSREEYDTWFAAALAGETPPPAAVDCELTIEIKANNTLFDIDEFEVPAETEFCIAFENQEAVPHNVAIYDGGTALFSGEFLNTAGSISYVIEPLPAGEYRFICEAHPQAMVGDVNVTE